MSNLYKVNEIKKQHTDKFGDIITDGYFASAVSKEMMRSNDSMTDDIVNNVFANASSILNECPNPSGSGEFKKTGIVIGKVQSGKTSNFIALLALAFDNGYNLGIVIGSNTTELLTQNVNRIKSSFNVPVDRLVVLHSKDNHNKITPDAIRGFIENGQKVLIVTLKSPQVKTKKHMSRVSELFDDPVMANENTIIIDDEGDQATLNSKAYSKDIANQLAQTYKVAIEIKKKIKRHCFISITATPQANILIKTTDVLSPDFGKLIYPGRGYCGLSVFHGEEQDKYVKVIPEEEDSLLDSDGGVPASFYDALSSFYVSNAIRKSRGDMKVHSMLIHPSMKKFDHAKVEEKVNKLVKQWKIYAKNGIKDFGYINALREKLIKSYKIYKADGVVIRSFEEIEGQILECIRQSSDALVFNSDQINARSDAELYKTRIYIGGNILDRGITIKGLAITYIIRRAKGYSTVDNTEQRARWFGYKNVPGFSDYIDICRVWATEAIKKDFATINESDEDMWSSIDRNLSRGKNFKELPRYFLLQNDVSHKLKLTRPQVARTKELFWSEWKTQTYYVKDKDQTAFNMQLVESFKSVHKNNNVVRDFKGDNQHLYIYDVKLSDFLENLLDKFKFCQDEMNYAGYLNKLEALITERKLDDLIDVVWVRINTNEKRKILEDGSIQQFFRGRDMRPNEKGEYNYLGDRHTCDDRPDKIQVQIHYIKASNMPDVDFYSPSICIYVPNHYIDEVKIIGRED
ncbi:hypothetical protein NPL6_01845 [Metamycoplasma hyosynoviae]|nr:Z1 domain-containing protein [Metamycoplasma hyosynoviae]KDE44308.1 hypothetical protein NPL6_01845 [Metamycoplasma hyosynoviae]